VPIITTVLAAVKLFLAGDNALYVALAKDLSSRYCPVDRTIFLSRLGVLLAVCACIGLLLFAFAKYRKQSAQRRERAYIAACAVAAFAIGGAALVIFGLSGCGGATEAGLTWDWPW
jgi:hypothetical protein